MLLKHFDLLATAPDGVARLRELILTLAVQGKLVPQDPNDEPASVLLQRIRAEKDRLIAEGKIKRDKALPPIADEEKPFELPLGWEWVRGGSLFDVIRGVTYQKTDAREAPVNGHLPLLRANNIRTTVNFDDLVYVPETLISSDQLLQSGDYVVCLASGSKHLVGKAAAFPGDVQCSFGAFCGAIRPWQSLDYLSVYLASPLYRGEVSAASAGIGINNLKGSTLVSLCIPVPPIAEQSRIVARVEELMRLCDALEAKGQLDVKQHAQLLHTLLATLTDSATPEELAANWQRVATHFDLLLDSPEAVDALEQTILQLAVRGLLVPQDPSDEPASELLKKIRAEKDRLISVGKIKRDKPLPPIAEDEQPFELPVGWEWARLGAVSEFTNGFAFPSSEFSLDSSGVGIVKIGDIQNGVVSIDNMSYVSQRYASSVDSGFIVEPGNMLIAMSGATTGKLGFNRSSESFLLNQRVGKITLHLIRQEFAYQFLTTKIAENLSISAGSAIPNLSTAQIKEIVLPLPPLAEQKRIVARVEQLRQLCSDLRRRLTASSVTQRYLAEAVTEDLAA